MRERPSFGLALRRYGPWSLGIAVVAIGLAAYFDLRARVDALEAQAADTVPELAPPTAVPDAWTPAAAPGGSGMAATQGPPPAWTCSGGLSDDEVRAVTGRHGRAVLRCYEQRALQVPQLRGTLRVRLRVAAGGAVAGAYVSGIEDPPLVSCVGHAVMAWRFPPVHDGDCAVVELPFALGDD